MKGALKEPGTRRVLNQGINETKKEIVLRMLRDGALSVEKIAEYAGLDVAQVEQLAKL
ncbi:hypothetical protein C805_03166 [Eubacterium sp. 14-2]|uniref:hypothetical protein n=1 Tax=Eubacterium sp. 14-2 TaxID=1235790 RepID=UPI00033883E3|nr:hypothetical protein [Eubacterium sp. 14-2]EOT23502.1 hypothetical protein C805_03166 [Eubacterium sp. 14-2]